MENRSFTVELARVAGAALSRSARGRPMPAHSRVAIHLVDNFTHAVPAIVDFTEDRRPA
jgi:hypothetical protein